MRKGGNSSRLNRSSLQRKIAFLDEVLGSGPYGPGVVGVFEREIRTVMIRYKRVCNLALNLCTRITVLDIGNLNIRLNRHEQRLHELLDAKLAAVETKIEAN